MRKSEIKRRTTETDIKLKLNIDGKGKNKIFTEIGFLSHMLELFSKHGLFDIELRAKGDLHVDQHHVVEDIGIVLGEAFKKALKDKKGINRAGYFIFPMDEAIAFAAVDLSGRPHLALDVKFKDKEIGKLKVEGIADFFEGFVANLGCSLHVKVPYGRSDHHKAEAIFKAFAKSMKMACLKDKRMLKELPSTKGLL